MVVTTHTIYSPTQWKQGKPSFIHKLPHTDIFQLNSQLLRKSSIFSLTFKMELPIHITAVFHVITSVSGFVIGTCIMTFALLNLQSLIEVGLIGFASYFIFISVFYFLLYSSSYLCSPCSLKILKSIWCTYLLFTSFVFILDLVSVIYLSVLVCLGGNAASLLVSSLILLAFVAVKLMLCYFQIRYFIDYNKEEPVVSINNSETRPPTYDEVCPQPVNILPPAYGEIVIIDIESTGEIENI